MIISQLQLLFRRPIITLQSVSTHFLMNRSLILTMGAIQLIWLTLIVLTGASTKYSTILMVGIFSVMSTFFVLFLPVGVARRIQNLKDWLFESEKRSILFLCITALVIGVIYSSIQTEWTDEQLGVKAANIIANEGLRSAYTALGRVGWLGQQHPPLIPILFSLALRLPGPDLFYMRFLSVSFLCGTLVVTYFLGRELYSRTIGFLAAILLLSFPLVIRLGAAAMMDIPLAFFFSLALLLLVRLSRAPSYRLAAGVGVVIALGLLTKYIMVLVFLVMFLYFLFFKSFRKIFAHLVVAVIISMSIFAIWLSYANHIGILERQFDKILNFVGTYHFIKNIEAPAPEAPSPQPAVEETINPEPKDVLQSGIFRLGLESLFTRIPSSLGVYHAPLILFGLLYLLNRRKSVDLMMLLWIAGVSLALFLSLPDHRYFLPIFPAIAIAIALVLFRFPEFAERALLLGLLFCMSDLYLFANWLRESHLFLLTP